MKKQILYLLLLPIALMGCKQSRTPLMAAGHPEPSATERIADHPDNGIDNSKGSIQNSSKEKEDIQTKGIHYELPAVGKNELVVEHTGYRLSYNKIHNTPNWSAWCLTAEHTDGPVERSRKFWADPSIPQTYRVDYYDYKGSGYDRGHMCPAGDMKWSEDAMHDCFYMSNMCPQTGSLNSGAWNKLEMKCREWARNEGRLFIVCGPVYDSKRRHEQIGIDHAIDVPEGFFKAILSLRPGHEKAIGFYFYNDESRQSYKTATMTVDEVEELTGLDLFCALEDKLETKLESVNNLEAFTKNH